MDIYHSHKYYTNAIYRDSPTSYERYIDRCIELGQTVITSVEHGYQGNYWLLNELIEDIRYKGINLLNDESEDKKLVKNILDEILDDFILKNKDDEYKLKHLKEYYNFKIN